MPLLLILKGANQGQKISLDRERLVIGRNPDCDVIVPGNAVSRQHAQIVRVNTEFFLEDLQSRNKTYLNNQEVNGKVRLNDNDRIKICDFLCAYQENQRRELPPDLRPEIELEEDEGHASTVMSTVEAAPDSHLILDSQPAEKLKILLEITNSLAKTLQLEPLLPKIIDNLFQIFKQADRGFVVMYDEGTNKLIPKAIKTRRDRDESSAHFSRRILHQCIQKAQAFLTEDALSDTRFNLSQSVSDFRIRSVMCAPLVGQNGKVFGVIQLDTQDRNKKFKQDDLQLLVAVSNQAAVALENAKLHEELLQNERLQREQEQAKEIQRGFLPSSVPVLSGYEFFAHYESARDVGGDLYNFVPLANQRLAVMVGDVAGKGVPAALLMAKLTSDAQTCVLTEPDAAHTLTKLNQLLMRAGNADRFVTFALGILDVAQHRLSVVNAGHVPPLVHRAATGKIEEVACGDDAGLPLGVLDTFVYSSVTVDLAPGDCVVLCTDGVTEAMSPTDEPFGTERVMRVLQQSALSPAQFGRDLLDAVVQHADDRAQFDDITLVCFGRVA